MGSSKWVVDASHTTVEFSVKHMMFTTVKGQFATVEGVLEGDPTDLTSAVVTASVDVASITTRDAQRDGHLKSADFFDAENYPKLTFKSKRFEAKGDGEYKAYADLTIHGVTKEVAFDVTYDGSGKDPWGNTRIGLSAGAKINRKDFGLNWNAALEAGGFLVGDSVTIEIHLEAVQQTVAA